MTPSGVICVFQVNSCDLLVILSTTTDATLHDTPTLSDLHVHIHLPHFSFSSDRRHVFGATGRLCCRAAGQRHRPRRLRHLGQARRQLLSVRQRQLDQGQSDPGGVQPLGSVSETARRQLDRRARDSRRLGRQAGRTAGRRSREAARLLRDGDGRGQAGSGGRQAAGRLARQDRAGQEYGRPRHAAGAVARRPGLGTLFNFSVDQDEKQSSRYAAQLGQGGLGLPERDYYLGTSDDSKRIRDAVSRARRQDVHAAWAIRPRRRRRQPTRCWRSRRNWPRPRGRRCSCAIARPSTTK